MALFKILKGSSENLPAELHDGYCYYTIDESLFYIDYKDESNTLQRKILNAQDAAKTLAGASLSTILNSNDLEIPTSKAVLTAINTHTHNYAGSSSVGGAAISADKLNTDAGSETQPIYFANGIPVETTYTLSASVPSDAKFTDTTYSAATTSAEGFNVRQ